MISAAEGGMVVTAIRSRSDCTQALRALGEMTRLRIMGLLMHERRTVNEIADVLKTSQYNVSKHLRVMRDAGPIEVRKDGQRRLYRVADALPAKRKMLDLGCCTFRFDKLQK
jgi:DNA-binding transcriptional ArsR family regulator